MRRQGGISMRAHLAAAAACVLLVAGCDDSSHAQEKANPPAPLALLVRQDAEPAGGNCPSGGVAVHAGLDANGDDVLQDEEVAKTSYACGTVARPVLTRTVAVDAGAVCANGGTRVEAGRDANGDGVLDDAEVEQDAVVCAPPDAPPPPVLADVAWFPASAECPLGGYAVQSGADLDGDGVLSWGEVAQIRVVCDRVSYGFTIASQEDVVLFTAAAVVKGNVIVESPTLTGVFVYPDKVLGSIVIRNNPVLRYVWIRNTTYAFGDRIRGSLIVTGNPALESVSFPWNYEPRNATWSIGGDLYVARNPALSPASLEPGIGDFANLARVDGSITFEENAKLPSLALYGLRQVGGSLRILRNPAFEAGPPHGGSVVAADFIGGDVEIDGTGHGLLDLTNLGSLGGSLSVRNASSLLLYASELRVVFGSVRLEGNGRIDAAFDRLLSIEGDLSLGRNGQEYMARFDQLEWIGGSLLVSDNPQLRELSLPALRGASVLTLARNPLLADPRGHMSSLQKLETLEGLVVADDAALATLPLPALVSLRQLSVSGAPRLPTCEVQQLVDRAHPTAVSVTGTDDLAICP
jgi:hypothetical protein